MASAATSCARAAISAVGYVPSHILDFFLGSRISHTHFPQFRFRTPRYVGCLSPPPPPGLFRRLTAASLPLFSPWDLALILFPLSLIRLADVLCVSLEHEEEVEVADKAAAEVEVEEEKSWSSTILWKMIF